MSCDKIISLNSNPQVEVAEHGQTNSGSGTSNTRFGTLNGSIDGDLPFSKMVKTLSGSGLPSITGFKSN